MSELADIKQQVIEIGQDVSFIKGIMENVATKAYVLQMIAEHTLQTAKKEGSGISPKTFTVVISSLVAVILALTGVMSYLSKS